MRPNIISLITKGIKAKYDAYQARNPEKQAWLRAGNTGAMGTSGKCIGECPRLLILRTMGVGETHDMGTQLMFEGGHASEAAARETLAAAWDGVVLGDETVTTQWATTSGRPVGGSPDIVLARHENNTVRLIEGIEKKCVSSGYVFVDVMVRERPRTSHVLQAAHYAWQLGIPFSILYVSRAIFHTTQFQYRLVSDVKEHPAYAHNDRGELLSFRPHATQYQLNIEDNGTIVYVTPSGATVPTLVTVDMIRDFYEYVDMCLSTQTLPVKFSAYSVTGESVYNKCKTCPFRSACQNTSDFHEWTALCGLLAKESVV